MLFRSEENKKKILLENLQQKNFDCLVNLLIAPIIYEKVQNFLLLKEIQQVGPPKWLETEKLKPFCL